MPVSTGRRVPHGLPEGVRHSSESCKVQGNVGRTLDRLHWHTIRYCLAYWCNQMSRCVDRLSSSVCARNWRDATNTFDRVLQRRSGRSVSCRSGNRSQEFYTTAGGLGALDFDFKVASLHIQWVRRLPLDDPSKWRLFTKFWLDRVASPFGWEEILAGLNVLVPSIPIFYGTSMKQYYRFRCGVSSRPSYRDEANAQLLWGIRRLSIARVSLCESEPLFERASPSLDS